MEPDVSTKSTTAPASAKGQSPASQNPKMTLEAAQAINDANGLVEMIQAGIAAREDKTIKNRIIAGLLGLLALSMSANMVQYKYQPEPKLLSETTDGRIRPLPLLNDPMYSQKEILAWSQKCVESVYRLSWVDWETSLSNNSFCLSDAKRGNFADSLKKIGVLKFLTKELQGNLYATTRTPIMRNYQLNAKGYWEWIVDVPYTVNIDGRERGTVDVVMTMKVRRTSLVLREDGLWVDSYRIVPRSAQGR